MHSEAPLEAIMIYGTHKGEGRMCIQYFGGTEKQREQIAMWKRTDCSRTGVYSFLTLSVVYFHPRTGHEEYKCFLLNFILWCFWYHVLSSQSSNTISSTGIMNKEWIEAWTERENGTWGEWLCGQWNESYAFFSVFRCSYTAYQYTTVSVKIFFTRTTRLGLCQITMSSMQPWKKIRENQKDMMFS